MNVDVRSGEHAGELRIYITGKRRRIDGKVTFTESRTTLCASLYRYPLLERHPYYHTEPIAKVKYSPSRFTRRLWKMLAPYVLSAYKGG